MRRRSFALAAAGAALPLAWREALAANEFPARPIQVIVPYAAGGADIYIRPLQPALEKKHGVRLVIESVVGAGGTVGAARVKRAAPDGYTLLFCGSGALTIAPRLQAGAPVAADFVPLLNLVTIPYFIATKKGSPIRDLRGLTDFIKSRPGALSYGSPGFGTSPHLGMEALARKLGSSVTHIPFSGVATAMQSLLGGHIDAIIGAPSTVIPQVEAGTVSAVVVVSKDRFPLAPDVPSLAEAGIDLDVSTHFAFYAPKGTPAPIAARLALALSDAATDPAFRQALEATRTRIDVLPADVLARVLAEESARFGPLVSAVKS
jgi:tripartite-type tricarboxylate transporter receptor subunit TctC